MKNISMRKYEKKDCDRVLEINKELVHFLSPLTKEKLNSLIDQSEMFNVVEIDGLVEAFVLTFREGKKYDSINYLWFSEHYERFLYIDRVVVSSKMHGKKLGKLLYESVFIHARQTGVDCVAAEIDIEPPNPGSLLFHKKFGFKEVGQQKVAGGKKLVSLQVASSN
ncbi:MAG TPA: GNAT family N-acetyltransferase [Clostridia bacterium]|nr:GNAT family N-acetyltransferase [Clostridia bacterium]